MVLLTMFLIQQWCTKQWCLLKDLENSQCFWKLNGITLSDTVKSRAIFILFSNFVDYKQYK